MHAAPVGFKNFLGDAVLVGYDMKRFDDLLVESGRKYGIEFGNRRLDTLDVAKSIYGDKIKNYNYIISTVGVAINVFNLKICVILQLRLRNCWQVWP